MEGEERKVYNNLYEKSRNEFLFFLRNGSALKHYSGIFSMIMRLRQCCDHPSLVYRPCESQELENEIKSFLRKNEGDIEGINNFQKNSLPEIIENMKNNQFANCPICLEDMIEATLTKCCHIACYDCLSKT